LSDEASLSIYSFGNMSWCGHKGDVNDDGSINVEDVLLCVQIIIGTKESGQCELWRADFNSDTMVNVLDVVAIVNETLGD
ncbi:MAG: dockerin type I repeat-containing protein, partial [bacterium]